MRINFRKIRKFSEGFGQHLNAFLKPLALKKHQDVSAWMQHLQLCFNSENQTKDFSYTIFPVKKNKCWKIFEIMRKLLFNYSFYSHPEIGNFKVWQPHPSGLFQPIQRPLQADTEHVEVLIRSRDLESFRDSHMDLRVKWPIQVCGHDIHQLHFQIQVSCHRDKISECYATHNRRVCLIIIDARSLCEPLCH
jgi:hypothetical protein